MRRVDTTVPFPRNSQNCCACRQFTNWNDLSVPADLRRFLHRFTQMNFPQTLHQLNFNKQASHLSPLTSHLSRLTSHLSPFTSHVSRLTSHLSRLTFHVSPLTSHLSPLTSHFSLLQIHHLLHQLHRTWYIRQGRSHEVWCIVQRRVGGSNAADGRVKVIESFFLYTIGDF